MSNICRSLHGAHDTSFAPIPFAQTCPVEAPEDVERDVSGLLKQLGATRGKHNQCNNQVLGVLWDLNASLLNAAPQTTTPISIDFQGYIRYVLVE